MNEVHKWLEFMGCKATTEGSWVWCGEDPSGPMGIGSTALKYAGFKFSTKRKRFFHVSTKFLPGEKAEGLHTSPIPFPVGYVKRNPGPKKGSKRVKKAPKDMEISDYNTRVELTCLLATAPD